MHLAPDCAPRSPRPCCISARARGRGRRRDQPRWSACGRRTCPPCPSLPTPARRDARSRMRAAAESRRRERGWRPPSCSRRDAQLCWHSPHTCATFKSHRNVLRWTQRAAAQRAPAVLHLDLLRGGAAARARLSCVLIASGVVLEPGARAWPGAPPRPFMLPSAWLPLSSPGRYSPIPRRRSLPAPGSSSLEAAPVARMKGWRLGLTLPNPAPNAV